jgi:hypothetical protein
MTQEIAKVVWHRSTRSGPPVSTWTSTIRCSIPSWASPRCCWPSTGREGTNPGLLAVVAEEETLAEVTENINLARRLDAVDGITGILAAPHEFELKNGRVCHQGRPVSLIFMDFNNDVFLKLHRKHDLTPLFQAIRENRILNPAVPNRST